MQLRNAALTACAAVAMLAPGTAAAAPSPDRTAPTTPTNLRITATTSTSVSLAWNASTDKSSFSYVVRESTGVTFTVSQTQTSFTRTKLWPNRTYTYSVSAVDRAGNRSGSSNSVSHTTPGDTTAPTPPTLTVTSLLPTRVSLSWSESRDDVSQVFYSLVVDGGATADILWQSATSATVLSLAPGTTHSFSVVARDMFGNEARSNVETRTTPAATDTTPPSAPGNLRGHGSDACEAWLDWDAAADDSDPHASLLYRVYVNGELAGESTAIGNTSTVAYARTVGSNTFVVRAVDGAGNESVSSNALTFTNMAPC